MDLVLSDCMLHIAGFLDITPGAVQLVQLYSHLTQILHIKRLWASKLLCMLPMKDL